MTATVGAKRTHQDMQSNEGMEIDEGFVDKSRAAAAEDGEKHSADDDVDQQNSYIPYRNLPVYGEHKRAVSSVSLAPGRLTKNRGFSVLAATASADGAMKIWDINNGHVGNRRLIQHYKVCVGHSRGINDVCWNPVAPYVATASDDKTVRLWDAVTGDALVEFRGHDNFVFCVDQHHAMVVSGSFDETVKLWDIRSGDCVSTLPAHSDPVTAVSFNRDGTTVCSGSHDGLIRIWDVATGECLKTIYGPGNPPVSSVKYSPNGKYLLAGTLDSTIRLWPVHQTGSNKCAKTYECNPNRFHSRYSIRKANIRSSVYGPAISSSSSPPPSSEAKPTPVVDDNTGTDIGNGTQKKNEEKTKPPPTVIPHVNTKYSIVSDFTADGKYVVTGSENNCVIIYNLQTRQVQQVLEGYEDAVLAIAAHDTLPLLATGAMSADRRVEFWMRSDYNPV